MNSTSPEIFRPGRGLWRHRAVIVAIALSLCGMFIVMWYVSRVSSSLAVQAALRDAGNVSTAIREFRTLYTSEVVERVRPLGIVVAHDY